MWEDRRLRDLTEADIRQLIESEVGEHLQLEYKREPYAPGDSGAKESLLDICMFANAAGGILLIGVEEKRDEKGHATGLPDPSAPLGWAIPNPEQALLAIDARVVTSVQEKLVIESVAIPTGDNRHVLAIRIPNSANKPHCVAYQKHNYFPIRRDRHRDRLDIREIKDLAMRAATQFERAETRLKASLAAVPLQSQRSYVIIACIPVFWRDFIVDVQDTNVRHALSEFRFPHAGDITESLPITFGFHGLQRQVAGDSSLAGCGKRDSAT